MSRNSGSRKNSRTRPSNSEANRPTAATATNPSGRATRRASRGLGCARPARARGSAGRARAPPRSSRRETAAGAHHVPPRSVPRVAQTAQPRREADTSRSGGGRRCEGRPARSIASSSMTNPSCQPPSGPRSYWRITPDGPERRTSVRSRRGAPRRRRRPERPHRRPSGARRVPRRRTSGRAIDTGLDGTSPPSSRHHGDRDPAVMLMDAAVFAHGMGVIPGTPPDLLGSPPGSLGASARAATDRRLRVRLDRRSIAPERSAGSCAAAQTQTERRFGGGR